MAHFDRAIPPGGEGKVTLTVHLKGLEGPVWKSATVISNDPGKPSITLNLQGKVRPAIEVRPTNVIRFKGEKSDLEEKRIDLIATSKPFQILRVENNLKEKISTQLNTIVKGQYYQLKVMIRQKTSPFSGFIQCFTDLPQKPEIRISVVNQLNG